MCGELKPLASYVKHHSGSSQQVQSFQHRPPSSSHTPLLLQTITGLERDLAISRTDCTARDDALGERETRIASMRRRVQELEKFKFVLDYKLKETRAALQPKEDEAGSLHDQIQVWHCLVQQQGPLSAFMNGISPCSWKKRVAQGD